MERKPTDIEFWQKTLTHARKNKSPSPEDTASEMLCDWLDKGRPWPVRLEWLFADVARRVTKYNRKESKSYDPLHHASYGHGSESDIVFSQIVGSKGVILSEIGDDDLELLERKLRRLLELEQRFKQAEKSQTLEEIPEEWPLPICTLKDLADEHIRQTLLRCGNNRTKAAKILGISLRCIKYRINDINSRYTNTNRCVPDAQKLGNYDWQRIIPELKPRQANDILKNSDSLILQEMISQGFVINRVAIKIGYSRGAVLARLKCILKWNLGKIDKGTRRWEILKGSLED